MTNHTLPSPRSAAPSHIAGIVSSMLVLGVLAATTARAAHSDIVPPSTRATAVEAAVHLAAVPAVPALPANLKNPFFPAGFTEPDPAELKQQQQAQGAAQPAKPSTDAQILAAIADWLNPQGTFLFGSDYILLVREKKLKVGDRLTITFEGHDYPVEITAIDSSSYSLRLNHTEITRPINPGKSP